MNQAPIGKKNGVFLIGEITATGNHHVTKLHIKSKTTSLGTFQGIRPGE
jgi:hypothetical protein